MTRFQEKCVEAAELWGTEVIFYDRVGKPGAYEDDGFLHITRGKIRAVFTVQSDDPAEQNRVVRLLCTTLGVPITNSVLTGENT